MLKWGPPVNVFEISVLNLSNFLRSNLVEDPLIPSEEIIVCWLSWSTSRLAEGAIHLRC